MSIEDQIRKIVSENLPEQTAGVMQEFIDEAGANKLRLGEKTKALEVANKELKVLRELKTEAEATVLSCKGREIELDEREEFVAARERDAEHINELHRMELECARENTITARHFFETVFRNVNIRRTVTGNREAVTPAYESSPGCGHGPGRTTLSENKTVEEIQE